MTAALAVIAMGTALPAVLARSVSDAAILAVE
jgi:hypothetical protein